MNKSIAFLGTEEKQNWRVENAKTRTTCIFSTVFGHVWMTCAYKGNNPWTTEDVMKKCLEGAFFEKQRGVTSGGGGVFATSYATSFFFKASFDLEKIRTYSLVCDESGQATVRFIDESDDEPIFVNTHLGYAKLSSKTLLEGLRKVKG